jgi:predicted dinucleotide-binding enzyme
MPTAAEAADAGDFVVIAVPLKLTNDMPVKQLAGKVVIDTNNYMAWRDGTVFRGSRTAITVTDLNGGESVHAYPSA